MSWKPRIVRGGRSDAAAPAPGGAQASDADLVGLAQAGLGLDARAAVPGAEAFAELVRRYQPRVLALAWHLTGHREDARDVAQDAFLRAFRSLSSFRPDGSFERWLLKITVNAARDEISRRSRRSWVPLESVPEASVSADARTEAEDSIRAGRVLEGLGELAPREREVFVLRDLEGLDVEEIAVLLALEAPTVRRHLARARLRLRRMLGGETGPT